MAKRFKGNPEVIAKILLERVRRKLKKIDNSDKHMGDTLLRAALLIESHAVLFVTKKLNRNSKGFLRERIGHKVVSNTEIRVGVFGVPYARIHEKGGVIVPKTAKSLAIPIHSSVEGKRAKNVPGLFRPKGSDMLFQKQPNGDILALFVLRKSVTIPARPYLKPAIGIARQRIIELVVSDLRRRFDSD